MSDNLLLQGRTILIVDDESDCRTASKLALESEGALVIEAVNGQQAIDTLTHSAVDINLVLMDVMMPVMDGLSAIRQLRQNPQFKELPIIALTAKSLKSDRDECMMSGASDYLTKPVSPTKLFSVIQSWLWSESD